MGIKHALEKLPLERNCLGTVNSLYNFLGGSSYRHAIFKNSQLTNKAITIKRVDITRWSAKERAVNEALSTYDFVLDSLIFI